MNSERLASRLTKAAIAAAVCASPVAHAHGAPAQGARSVPQTGTIVGHVTFEGKAPGNPIIRMGMDPKCSELNRGHRVVQEQALVALDGSVGNAFVRLDGSFPRAPVPSEPVVINQRACVYGPRVVGVRVGQRLQIHNSDKLLHNVHSSSASSNSFNVGQPTAGTTFEFVPKTPEVMVKLGCDVHRWMIAFVGVVEHPFFAVTNVTGQFTIAQVPVGSYMIRTWHEQFGERSQPVSVRAGATSSVDVRYDGDHDKLR